METVILKSTATNGEPLVATFAPQRGMNLVSFKKGDIEFIDQSTKGLFDERNAGLGAMIGPHFHRRRLAGESSDPYSHGIGRYAAWAHKSNENSIQATLKGSDLLNDVPLKELEGQNFVIRYDAKLTEKGLHLHLSVVSDTDSLIGIHYYYHLPEGKGQVSARVKEHFLTKEGKQTIPPDWNFNRENHQLIYELDRDTDFTFYTFPDPTEGEITLTTPRYTLKTRYSCICEENAWQLYHPKGASFVCIEPISSQDPHHPNLTVSGLDIDLLVD